MSIVDIFSLKRGDKIKQQKEKIKPAKQDFDKQLQNLPLLNKFNKVFFNLVEALKVNKQPSTISLYVSDACNNREKESMLIY